MPLPSHAGDTTRSNARCRTAPAATLHAEPEDRAEAVSECLFGEAVDVLERRGEWCRVRNRRDGYEGHLRASALGEAPDPPRPVHVVGVRATLLFAAPDPKSRVLARLPFGAELVLDGGADAGPFARLLGGAHDGAFVPRAHCLAPGGTLGGEPVDLARRLFDGAPYRWGGRTPDGADCSGLVQGAAFALGIRLPRDSAEQEAFLAPVASPAERRRSDLVFWPGHVALLLDADTVFHATAHVLATAVEPLSDVVTRAGEPSSFRRLPCRSEAGGAA